MDPVSCRRSGKLKLSTSGHGGLKCTQHTNRRTRRLFLLIGRANSSRRCRPRLWPISSTLLAPSTYPSGMVLFCETATGLGHLRGSRRRGQALDQFARRPPPELPHRQGWRSAGPFLRALRRRVRNDRGHALPGQNRAHFAAGLSAIHVSPSRRLPVGGARDGSHLQHRLRATAHGGPLDFGARAPGAPAAGVERRARSEARTARRVAASRSPTSRSASSSAPRAKPLRAH